MDNNFFLFDLNRERLRRVFLKLSKNEKRVNFIDFQRLCLSGKLIPGFVSQNQLRAIAGKFGNMSSLTKLFLTFEQFEQFLKIISMAKSQPANRQEKAKLFFSVFSQALRIQFLLGPEDGTGGMIRSNSSYSIGSNAELNESNSSLDLSIKEALNTLKSDTQRTVDANGRVTISPRPIGRAYSNPSTPKGRNSYRSFNTEMANAKVRVSLLPPSQSYKNVRQKNNKMLGELDEFLENEKMVQKEVLSVKVNLKGNSNKKVDVRGSLKAQAENPMNRVKYNERNRIVREDPKEKYEKAIEKLGTRIESHKNYILHIQNSHFGRRFVMGLCFRIWNCSIKRPNAVSNVVENIN